MPLTANPRLTQPAFAESPLNYDDLKRLAQELKRPLHTLIALSDDNDPFLADRPGRRLAGAEWFAALWDWLDIPDGVHLRRLHYLLVSTAAITLPNGETHLNTHKCWKFLCSASADARFLDLVPADAFVDRRAPEPIVYIPRDEAEDADFSIYGIVPVFPACADVPLLQPYTPQQYEFPLLPLPHLTRPKLAEVAIEAWAEKSTQNDILLPLAQAEHATLVTGVGELSITACLALVRRVRAHRRPTRILYLSDHDPSGDGMPTSVARKLEYFLRRDGDDLDIKLIPIVLTAEQVSEYDLPRVPIKDSDKRRATFEKRHGEGAVELDALEALHPGALAQIVREAIDRYRASKRQAERAIAEMASIINNDLTTIRDGVLNYYADDVARLRTSFEQVQSEIAERQAAIAAALDTCRQTIAEQEQAIAARLEQWRECAAPVWEAIASDLEDALPDLSEIEWPQPEADEDDAALFDSSRGYLEQIARYKAHLGKPTTRRARGNGGAPP